MNPKLSVLASALVMFTASTTWAESKSTAVEPKSESASTNAKKNAEGTEASGTTQASKSPNEKAPSTKDPSVKSAPELAASKELEEANKQHIRPARAPRSVPTAPPAVKAETKPPSPATGLVWVPGHWVPFKGEWIWRAGEWGFPATPISVWIEPTYDAKAKTWTPGYWQPDREEPYDKEVRPPEEDRPPTPKFL